jgi:hypothetical protein
MDGARREAGQVLGVISDAEVMLLVRIYEKNMAMRVRHEFGRFDGRVLLLVAASDRRFRAAEEENSTVPTTEVWSGISSWLGLEG